MIPSGSAPREVHGGQGSPGRVDRTGPDRVVPRRAGRIGLKRLRNAAVGAVASARASGSFFSGACNLWCRCRVWAGPRRPRVQPGAVLGSGPFGQSTVAAIDGPGPAGATRNRPDRRPGRGHTVLVRVGCLSAGAARVGLSAAFGCPSLVRTRGLVMSWRNQPESSTRPWDWPRSWPRSCRGCFGACRLASDGFLAAGGLVFALIPELPDPDPRTSSVFAVRVTELCAIVSLMGAGLALNRPVGWRRWATTWRRPAITMPLSMLGAALLGWGLSAWASPRPFCCWPRRR